MNESSMYEILLAQQKQIRQLTLHLEALKRMMFEHRPPFVASFEHQLGALESSDFLRKIDDAIRELERSAQDSRKS
jgi:hypothetical protein